MPAFRGWKIPSHIFHRLQKSVSKACVFRLTFSNCVSQFREDMTSVRVNPRSGRPAEAVTPTMVVNIVVIVDKDRRVILQEVTNWFSIGKTSAQKILRRRYDQVLGGCRNNWQKTKKRLGWPWQKNIWDENKFLNCIVTRDGMWVHYAEPETKAQSRQWIRAGSPPPKKLSPSAGKVMLVVFWD